MTSAEDIFIEDILSILDNVLERAWTPEEAVAFLERLQAELSVRIEALALQIEKRDAW